MTVQFFGTLVARLGLALALLAFAASACAAYDSNEPYVREVRGDFVSVVWPWADAEVARRARAVAESHCQQSDRQDDDRNDHLDDGETPFAVHWITLPTTEITTFWA